jgi:ketosteroid isomerase-like protein
MSAENVERIRASAASWDGVVLRPDARPFERIFSLEATAALVDPEAVYEDVVLPDHAGEAYRGVDAWVRAAEGWLEPCEWMVVDLEQIVDADDRVVALHRAHMKMRHTGLEFEMSLAYIHTLKDGRIVHTRAFADHEDALAAVGLAG